MKKQFNRVKQLANQTVGRAEKTEVLSDDLLQIERRMEIVRMVSHNAYKKLALCLQGHVGTDAEKRHKKLPLMVLSQAMVDGGTQLGEECMIGKMMEVCGEAESKLAYEQSQHEVQLEKEVLEPLNQLAEFDIPNIIKQRKQLAKLVLDYDSAKARYHQASKAILTATNNQAMAAKADSCKEEMDEAHNKVEICKDQLAADMYNFSSKEGEYARYYVMLLEEQAEYHRRSLACIESVLPAIRSQQDTWMEKPAFGTALEEHLKRSNREIALPIEACVMMLLETGMKEEGLFRIAAGASKLKKLKAALDCSTSQLEEFYSDPHAVAGALKSYLRELPEPLMTFQMYDEWIQASNVADPDKRLQALWVVCDSLPKANKANLKYLVKFLAKLAQESDVNKMTPSNIAIVLGPNLLWAKTEGTLAEMAAATSVHVVAIIEPIIQHADWFFPEDVEFNVSGVFVMPTGPVHQSGHPVTPEPEYATIERRRPGSLGGLEPETPRKDSVGREPTSTPPPLRNGPGGSSGSPGQLNIGTPTSASKGPSPHLMRRGTKKQAPAPPKVAPSPSFSATTPLKATPPSSIQVQYQTPVATIVQPATLPRRHSNNQIPIHAPSHPPPQPPQNAADPEPSPPNSPTPPGTPPHDSTHSASLSRPRPVPRPRPRPSVPPPPQPPGESTNGVCNSASKIITDVAVTLKGSGRLLVPHIAVEQPVTTPPEAENQSESTIF
ncbi:rho GTPase-activating protein 17b isoform X4 [Tachysurus fulvidraco]|uniref:rho GTPase-activating protein 17b isoform X4 n=1 Tax=Tachysurus fulvidraco TaxID=1234273 RepID=UPI000F4FAA6B|nr:rho GTPase-activating protein 17b isoform X4 [Tachysurus fulvidraco]